MATVPPIVVGLEAVSKEFRHVAGPVIRAVDRVTLSLEAGSILGILGTNGSGKTTLLKLIGGILQPTLGHVRRADEDTIAAARPNAPVQLAIPKAFIVDDSQTVAQVLMDVARRHDMRSDDVWNALDAYAIAGQIREQREYVVDSLSQGHRTILAIVCALLGNPRLLLLDDPTQTLDSVTTDLLVADLIRVARVQGTTMVVASTDPNFIQKLCDTVAVLHQGQMLISQAMPALLEHYAHDQYQIRFQGHVDVRWQDWFDGLLVSRDTQSTTLTGIIPDQSALHGILMRVRDLNLPLVSVNRVPPDLQAVYLQLLRVHDLMRPHLEV